MNTKRRGLVGSWYTCNICGAVRPARKFSEIAPKACVCKRCKEVENDAVVACNGGDCASNCDEVVHFGRALLRGER